ncbi:MAG: ABC transporter permease [Bacteroidota bacterium]
MSRRILDLATLRESTLMALSAIRANKLRSALTLLGIVVGVFSIIAVMTAMGVLRNSIEEGMAQLGANTFQIQKFPVEFGSDHETRRRLRNRKNITYEQALEVQRKATLAEAVGIEAWQFGKTVVWGGRKSNPNVSVCGENLDGLITNDWVVGRGRGLTTEDLDQARRVAILGISVAEKVFPEYADPVGESVRIDGQIYEVVGVFEKKGNALGEGQDNFAVIPITTYFGIYGKHARSINIMVKALNREVFEDCLDQTRSILRAARNVPPGAEDDFAYFSNDRIIEQFNEITSGFRLGVLLVSSIALLAAGVGIMNIMLVSVTERTREIGIRKAVGAMRRDVLAQFMTEAIILSQLGGVAGVLLGIVGGNVVSILLEIPAVVPWDWAALGLAVCTLVGLAFGVYPAWKAATLDPIESLRYE